MSGLARRRFPAPCFAVVTTLLFLASPQAVVAQSPGAAQVSLFSPDPAAAAAAGLADDAYLVRLDADGLARVRDLLLGGSPVSIPLPVAQEVVLEVVLVALAPTGRGYSLVGYPADAAPLPGEPPAEVVRLTVRGDDVAGEVVSRLGGWTLAGEVGLNGVVVSPHAVRPPSHRVPDAVLPPDLPARALHRRPWVEPAYQADILVVVLRSVVDQLGSVGRAQALADNWVQSTNAAFAASRAPTRLRLVAALPARSSDPYRSEKLGRTLTHLATSADDEWQDGTRPDPHGVFDWVLDARQEHRADLVHLIADDWRRGTDEPCGRAFLGSPAWTRGYDDPEPFTVAGSGFAITRRNCGFTTFAHEVGHNFGLRHDRYRTRHEAAEYSKEYPRYAYGLVDFDPAYVFGYVNQARFRRGSPGRVWPPRRDAWGTIMSYEWFQCRDWGFYCYELPLFSSPRWTYHGDPGGVPGVQRSGRIEGPADAVRVFTEFSSLTTHNLRGNCLRNGWRLNLQTWTGDFVRAEHGGGGRVVATRALPLAQETFVVDADFPGCIEHGSAISLRSRDGSYLRAVNGGGGLVDARGSRPGTWERFVVERVEEQDGLIGPVDDVAVRSADGSYLRVRYRDEGGRALRAEAWEIGPWERFVVTVHRP